MNTGLKGKVVIVAASSRGIGLATAEAFAAEGSHVAMCARDVDNLRAAAERIRSRYHSEVFEQPLNLADGDAIHAFVRDVAKRFGSADICVTSAGGPPAKDFLAIELEEWRVALEVNFLSVVRLARESIPYMKRNHWGRIITITSTSVRQAIPGLVLSTAVRPAVVGLVKSLALEFGRDGITVNNVAPGHTDTERQSEVAKARALATGVSEGEIRERWAVESPLQRLGHADEIADAIVWLASERAAFITGQTILVDGGMYRGM